MENTCLSNAGKSLKEMFRLRDALETIIDFDKSKSICSEFVSVAVENDITLFKIVNYIESEVTRSFARPLVRELGLLRLEHDLPIELKNRREEHITKVFSLLTLTGPIEDYFERYVDLNTDAEDKPWIFSKYTVRKSLDLGFKSFNKAYQKISKTSFIKPMEVEYLDSEGAKEFFNFIDKVNKYIFDYYNKEIIEKLRKIHLINESDLSTLRKNLGLKNKKKED